MLPRVLMMRLIALDSWGVTGTGVVRESPALIRTSWTSSQAASSSFTYFNLRVAMREDMAAKE
jgi:hypothetical protein